jgi:hypothetical protein
MMDNINSISKVFVILNSIKESKYNYIEVVNPQTDDPVMKVKLNLEEDAYVDFLDTFFDAGFKIRGIDKKDFDDLDTDDIVKFNL